MTQPKRFKHSTTLFEQLPNELFIEIFAYLNGVDTIYAISHLNHRFQSLLMKYVNIFDFKFINKPKFDHITRHYDIHQWRSLSLSEDDKTPGQIRLFFQLYPPHQYLSQLQSLSALNMTPNYTQEFLSQIVSLNHLVSLELGDVCGEKIQAFELPSLKRLVVTGCIHTTWIMKLHSLEKLEYKRKKYCYHPLTLAFPSTLKELKLFYVEETSTNDLLDVLRSLSQLRKLVLYNGNCYVLPNGEIWERFIQSSLPLLRTFKFCFKFHDYSATLDDINQMVASFSTPFYSVEKRWFIRCIVESSTPVKGIIYSLPYAFEEMLIDITSFDTSFSTLTTSDVDEREYESCEKVKRLVFNDNCQIPYHSFLQSNIVQLVLETTLSTSWYFLLNNLQHLELKRFSYHSPAVFADVLVNAPQLQSLTLPIHTLSNITDKFTNNVVCDLLSQRIKSLTIVRRYYYKEELDYVTIHNLSAIVRIFGKTCEHLSLGLGAHPKTALPILRRMQRLRSLHVRCVARKRTSDFTAATWLEQSLLKADTSNFMYSTDDLDFYIWFGNRLS